MEVRFHARSARATDSVAVKMLQLAAGTLLTKAVWPALRAVVGCSCLYLRVVPARVLVTSEGGAGVRTVWALSGIRAPAASDVTRAIDAHSFFFAQVPL